MFKLELKPVRAQNGSYYCPECMVTLTQKSKTYTYCLVCGQKIDWREVYYEEYEELEDAD